MSEETNVTQMRETIERLSKEKAGLQLEVKTMGGQLRVYEAKDAFRAQGFNPNHGELFAAQNPEGEITAEAVVAFTDKHGLATVGSTQESSSEGDNSAPKAAEGTANLAPLAGSGSRAGDGGAGASTPQVLTRQEYQELYATDPAAAQAAIASGRVEVSRDNPYVRDRVGATKGTNPYADFTKAQA